MSAQFTQSLASGPHLLLARFIGNWKGTIRTWFEPDVLAEESPVAGNFVSLLGGRFIRHEYAYQLAGEAHAGVCLHGFDLAKDWFVHAWLDSAHNGTTIMVSTGAQGVRAMIDVLGSYPDGQGGPDWGWRTQLSLSDGDHLAIVHFNIPPHGVAARAVQIDYERTA